MSAFCFFNTAIAWGGGEKWHLEAAQILQQQGRKVLMVCHPKSILKKRAETSNILVVPIKTGKRSFLDPFKVKKLSKWLQEESVQTLVLNLSQDLKMGGLAAKKAGVLRIIYRRGSAIPVKNSCLNRYLFSKVITEVLANSQATLECILTHNENLFPRTKTTIIPNPVEVDTIRNKKCTPYYQKRDKEIVLVNLGRMEKQKNQTFLLDVAKALKQRSIPFKMLIGGTGRLESLLLQKAKDLELTEYVDFPGFIERPEDFMKTGDVFLLPSLWEGFGYVLAEAGACEKSTVAFDVSSNPEVIVNGKTGFLTPVNKVDDFADAIEKLYRDAALRHTMGKAAFNYVKKQFDAPVIQKKIQQYLCKE